MDPEFDEFLKYCDGATYPAGEAVFETKIRAFVTSCPVHLQVNETLPRAFLLDRPMMAIVQAGWEVRWHLTGGREMETIAARCSRLPHGVPCTLQEYAAAQERLAAGVSQPSATAPEHDSPRSTVTPVPRYAALDSGPTRSEE